MRRTLVVVVALAACDVPDKHPSATDGGVDTTTPGGPIETEITAAPAEFSPSATATFEFTSNLPSAKFQCAFDGDKAEACTSPLSRKLADGSHTFAVRATDGNGMGDLSPAEHVWTIDTVAPATTLTEMPPAADNSTMVTFEFTANEMNVVFECSLDNAAYAPCTTGQAFGPIDDGAHAFAVRAKDRAGNIDASPAIHAWQVDTTTPDTTLLTGPPNASPSASATFTFLSPDAGPGATFQCALDGSAFADCSSPRMYSGLAEGSHTFQVRVRDAGGNFDPTPATDTWTIDLTAPETMLVAAPSGAVAAASASFTFTSTEANVTFSCSLDGAGMAPCTSPFTATGLAQGPHAFAVVATDAAGHADPSPATAAWTVDTLPPELMLVAGPDEAATTGPRVTFMFAHSEGMTECSVDGAAYVACTSPAAYNLAAGAHSFSVRAVDAAGNTTIIARSFTVACSPPDPTGAAGVLHLDDPGQLQANATGGAAATLGTSDMAELVDPTPATGRFGAGLTFAAAEGDLVAWPAAIGPVTAFTVELWARPDALAGARDVLATGDGRVALRVTRDTAQAVRFTATVTDGSGTMYTVSSAPAAAGAWHWLLVSLEAPVLRLWVDGVLATNDSVQLGSAPFDALRLGGSYGGTIDEVFVATTPTSDDAALARYCPL